MTEPTQPLQHAPYSACGRSFHINRTCGTTTSSGSILQWSSTNKLKLNTLKTKEIVFHRPRLPNRTLPPLLPGIERVSSAKILGVTFTATLSPELHINNIIAICNQRLYLLSQLKQQNLSEQALALIFHALIISKITGVTKYRTAPPRASHAPRRNTCLGFN